MNKKILIAILIAVVLIFAGIFSIIYLRKGKIPSEKKVVPQPTKAPKILTPEEIQEDLSKKAEISPDIKPLTPEEINKALEKEAPKKEKTSPLTPEEIQKALERK